MLLKCTIYAVFCKRSINYYIIKIDTETDTKYFYLTFKIIYPNTIADEVF